MERDRHAVEWIAHRGESADAPENTLAAFRLAWERGNRAIELDFHLSLDGDPVVCHDADTLRTTGVAAEIRATPTRDLLRLDAGRWKGEQWAGERMPLLSEALATVPPGCRCFAEAKVGPEGIRPLERAIGETGLAPDQVVVISFHPESVAEARRRLRRVPAMLLSGFRRDEASGAWKPAARDLIAQARDLGAHGLSVLACEAVDEGFASAARAAGLLLYVWTIDDLPAAHRMLTLGVDGITSNRAAWLQAQCRAQTPGEQPTLDGD